MVELRSRNLNMHFIRTIKGSSVELVNNVDAKRRPEFKLRQLGDVYKKENVKHDESILGIQLRVIKDAEQFSDMAEGSCTLDVDMKIKAEPEDFDMTMAKFRKECKENKRKRVNLRHTETTTQIKQERLEFQTDDGCDLEEPLSNWTTKFSKRRKKKQGSKTTCGSSSSTFTKKNDLLVLIDVKREVLEDDYSSVSELMDFIPADPSPNSRKESESPREINSVEEITHDTPKDTTLTPYGSVDNIEPSSPAMATIVSGEFKDSRISRDCIAANITLPNHENVLNGSVSKEETELEEGSQNSATFTEFKNTGFIKNPIPSNNRTESTVIKEEEESNHLKLNFSMDLTCSEVIKLNDADTLATGYSGFPITDFSVKNGETVSETEDIDEDNLSEATTISQLVNCCNSDDNSHSGHDDFIPLGVELRDCASSKFYNARNGVTTAPETDGIQHQKLHQTPEKLHSGRNVISPTSQAKLIKAMEHPDSPEKRNKKCKGKLYFSSQNPHRILKAQGLDNIDRVEYIPNSKQAIQKANSSWKTQYQKDTHKTFRRDTKATKLQPFSTGCTSIRGCSQKAIEFSQRQMRDFQYIAAKLTNELKSMKQTTKRCLLAENSPSTLSDSYMDEVKTSIGNAEKLKESSKRWLSMMERDCNRFCKLMGMVQEDSVVTKNIIEKKKKIKFADEAGGDLCHVKVFEIDLESVDLCKN